MVYTLRVVGNGKASLGQSEILPASQGCTLQAAFLPAPLHSKGTSPRGRKVLLSRSFFLRPGRLSHVSTRS